MDCYMKRYGAPSIVVDRFNRANGNLGNADSGQAWQSNGANTTAWIVSSNVAKRASVTNSVNDAAYIDCGRSDVIVSADITMGGFSQGSHLVARMSGNTFNNSMSMYLHPTGQVALRKRIAGSDTFLGTTTFSYVAGTTYACRLECKGNNFKIYINDVLKVSVTDDNALKTNTKVGMFLPLTSSAASDFFDNFSVKG